MDTRNTKLDVIQKALLLFKENGFEKTSILQICKAAGVTRNTFYYYFSSKDDLISEYFKTALSASSEVFSIVLAEDTDWKRYLKLFELHLAFLKDQGVDFTRQVVHSILTGENELLQKYIVTEEWCIPILTRCISEGLVRNDFSAVELNTYVNQLCLGITLVWCSTNANFNLWAKCKQGMELFLLNR